MVMKERRLCQSILAVATVAIFAGCDESQVQARVEGLELGDVTGYWAVRGKDAEENNYIHPVIRFRVLNHGAEAVGYVQAMAVFKRESLPDESWGNDFLYSIAEEPIAPGGASDVLTMRSDTNFISKDAPEQMFQNEKWERVNVEIFLRVGASTWRPVLDLEVPKRIGAPGLEKFLDPTEPADSTPREL